MRSSILLFLLCATAVGCGLIDDDVTRLKLRFPRHDFRVDSADWKFSGSGTVPSVSCQIGCDQAAATLCSGGCRGSCEAASGSCQASVTITLVNDYDLAVEASEYQQIADKPLISVEVDTVFFDISDNTLNTATPPLKVYFGPTSVTRPDDAGAELVGTIASVAPRQTGQVDIAFEGSGRAIMKKYMDDFHTPFRVLVASEITVHAGDPVPAGRLVGSVQATATAGL